MKIKLVLKDCGTGAGGFQPGNTCASGRGSGGGSSGGSSGGSGGGSGKFEMYGETYANMGAVVDALNDLRSAEFQSSRWNAEGARGSMGESSFDIKHGKLVFLRGNAVEATWDPSKDSLTTFYESQPSLDDDADNLFG